MALARNVGRQSVAAAVVVMLSVLGAIAAHTALRASTAHAEPHQAGSQIRIDPDHPWRPPFGLERIGRPLTAVVEIASAPQPRPEYWLVGYAKGEKIARSAIVLRGKSPYVCRATFNPWPTELVLVAKSARGAEIELARQAVAPAAFEADAVARPDRVINPVDLGAILVPSDWLLLAGGQKGHIEVAAIRRTGDGHSARVATWFESAPAKKTAADLTLVTDRRPQVRVPLPPVPADRDRGVVHVSISAASGA